ncbi:MAG: nucleoside-triphosphatase [Bacteroidia bacterium]
MIYILTGPIRTGKTTRLHTWLEARQEVAGILTPDGEDGLRRMYDINKGLFFPFEINANTEDVSEVLEIGRFRFLQKAFEQANAILEEAANSNATTIVIDEWGKLEAKGQGLAASSDFLLTKALEGSLQADVIVVVRDSLLENFHAHCKELIPNGEAAYSPRYLHLPMR